MDSKPTINAIIQDGNPIQIHISLAGKIDKTQLKGVENATIKLFVNDVLADDLEYIGEGFYQSARLGEQGKHYLLQIDIPNFPTTRCETYLPNSEFIRSIQHINNAGKDQDGLNCPALKITFTNNPDKQQYFNLSVGMLVHSSSDPIQLLNITDPVILGEGLPILVFSNRMIKDTTYTMYLEYTTGLSTNINAQWIMDLFPLIVELRSIDLPYYHFLRSVYLYQRNLYDTDIGEIYPPYSLYSNVPNGYGIVGSFSKHTYDTIFPKR
jgi:hypothetical protein